MLAVGEEFPPELLREIVSRRAREAGKRAVIFFYEADDTDICSADLRELDDVGGELYLRATDIIGVRNANGAAKGSAVKHAFVNFVEDRRDRIRTELGVASARASFVVDATGTIVSTASSGHAANALSFAESYGWEREAGWEKDFGGVTDAEPPPAEARWEADAARRLATRRALNLPDPAVPVEEEQGIFGEWKDPDPALYPNPIGKNLQGVGEKLKRGARSSLDDALDGVDDAADKARSLLDGAKDALRARDEDKKKEGQGE